MPLNRTLSTEAIDNTLEEMSSNHDRRAFLSVVDPNYKQGILSSSDMNVTSGRVLTSAEKTIQPSGPVSLRKPRVILAATGSLSASKFPALCRCFLEWAEVILVVTESSLRFFDMSAIPRGVQLYTDNEEWSFSKRIRGMVLHIELGKWADLMVIAPLTANTLAKISAGLCDNLLTCIVRGWDQNKPLYLAPSMQTTAWNNAITEQHLSKASLLGMRWIMPTTRKLDSGDSVTGLMGEPADVYNTVRSGYDLFSGNRG